MAIRLGATPVPIPNTMVKTQPADGTALVTVWESRWPPNPKKMVKTQPADGTALVTVWESRWPPNPKKKNRIVVRYRYWQHW